MKTHALRILPNKDLRLEIEKYATEKKIKAGAILTCVGNLNKVILRMAGGKKIKSHTGSYEIVSLVGTLEIGNSHLHIAVADNRGNVFGGHLRPGSIIGVTAEVVIHELKDIVFERVLDKNTGYEELQVK